MHLRDIPVTVGQDSIAGFVGILRECPYKSPYRKTISDRGSETRATQFNALDDCLPRKPDLTTCTSSFPENPVTGRSEVQIQLENDPDVALHA
jgi:hypothetical protein